MNPVSVMRFKMQNFFLNLFVPWLNANPGLVKLYITELTCD